MPFRRWQTRKIEAEKHWNHQFDAELHPTEASVDFKENVVFELLFKAIAKFYPRSMGYSCFSIFFSFYRDVNKNSSFWVCRFFFLLSSNVRCLADWSLQFLVASVQSQFGNSCFFHSPSFLVGSCFERQIDAYLDSVSCALFWNSRSFRSLVHFQCDEHHSRQCALRFCLLFLLPFFNGRRNKDKRIKMRVSHTKNK